MGASSDNGTFLEYDSYTKIGQFFTLFPVVLNVKRSEDFKFSLTGRRGGSSSGPHGHFQESPQGDFQTFPPT